MRKQVLKARLLSLAALCGIAIALASCSNEDISQNNTTGANDNSDKNLTSFVTGGPKETRTSMDYNTGNFFWEAGDKIYVKDDDGHWQASTNAPTVRTAYFKFKVPGKFNNHTSYKVYYPGKNGSNNQVSIPASQSQAKPNSTTHFGVSGDCGTADANKITGKNKFEFTLNHQTAILVFQPYTSNTILKDCYLTKVEVNADNDITDTYHLDPSSGEITGTGTGKQIVLTTKDPTPGSTNENGFPLNTTSASVTTNGAYMLIKPGTHTLKIRYWVKDVATNIEGTITKILTSHTYNKNTYYNMTADLDMRNYDGDHYYMWDAEKQYWDGYEWTHKNPAWQPTLNHDLPGATTSNFYPQSNSDPRYCNEGGGSGRFDATHASCKDLPNANELSWYIEKGDPRWDADELWVTMGRLYKGGMWFLKKDNIIGYDKEHCVNKTTDLRTTAEIRQNGSLNPGLPSVADASKYFYLPALGFYYAGKLWFVGEYGYYWSSSSSPLSNGSAYNLTFQNGSGAVLHGNLRQHGMRVQVFE